MRKITKRISVNLFLALVLTMQVWTGLSAAPLDSCCSVPGHSAIAVDLHKCHTGKDANAHPDCDDFSNCPMTHPQSTAVFALDIHTLPGYTVHSIVFDPDDRYLHGFLSPRTRPPITTS